MSARASGLARYALRRMLGAVPLLAGIAAVCFVVIHLAPGSPVDARSEMNPKMSLEARQKLTRLYGLDRPLPERLAAWAWRVVRFDLGRSFADGEAVAAKIGRAMPVTLIVNGSSLLLIFLAGVPLGVAGAVHAGRPLDRALSAITLVGFALPTFWLALLLVSFFGVHLRWLPVTGLTSLDHELLGPWERALDVARHLVLPVAVSSLTGLAGLTRYVRASTSEALSQNYVRTARAKGLPERTVLRRHALRNALLPVVTVLGLSVPALVGGSVLFESIFSLPGMGRLFYLSVYARDYPVVMGLLLIGAVFTLAGNLLADLAYAAVDPRIRLK